VDEELPRPSAEIYARVALEPAAPVKSLRRVHRWLRRQHDASCSLSLCTLKRITHQRLSDSAAARVGPYSEEVELELV